MELNPIFQWKNVNSLPINSLLMKTSPWYIVGVGSTTNSASTLFPLVAARLLDFKSTTELGVEKWE